MDVNQMKQRCPEAYLLGVAELHDYILEFTIYSEKRKCGCADILRKAGSTVYGILYEVNANDLANLDIAEGTHINKYRRITVQVASTSGETETAFAYEVIDKQPFQKPSQDYLNQLIIPAETFNFPKEYQDYLKIFTPF